MFATPKTFLKGCALAWLATAFVFSAQAETEDIRGQLETFLSDHCYECHDDITDKGDLNLLDLEFDIIDPGNFESWRAVYDAVSHGDMPPEGEKQPKGEAKSAFLGAINKPLIAVDREARKLFGRVQTRRLTRRE